MKRYGLRRLFHNDDFYDLDTLLSKDTFAVDIKDEEDKYIVEAELAGYSKEDISASLQDNWLEIIASKSKEINENDKYIYQERSTTTLKRKFYLNDVVDNEIDAKLENGILKIVLKKQKKETNGSKIEIK